LLGGQQAPEGIYYQNVFSYYNASASRNADFQGELLRKELKLHGSLDVYADQNIIGATTPFNILGASYGAMIDIPSAQVVGSGNASLDLATEHFDFSKSLAASRSSTATFNLADMYVEAINLGWHFTQVDVEATFGFFAPTGSYDAKKLINNGLGRWAEMGGLGAVVYLDPGKSWSLSAMMRYLTHQSQQGSDVRVGDDVLLEWGVGKTWRPLVQAVGGPARHRSRGLRAVAGDGQHRLSAPARHSQYQVARRRGGAGNRGNHQVWPVLPPI
jgi:hypothetical protein